jgi:osmoprotectant transport system ATP-binding protein
MRSLVAPRVLHRNVQSQSTAEPTIFDPIRVIVAMIDLRSVSKRYPDGTIAVHDLSISIDEGALCVLIGPSGCGKTTTLKMVNRLIEPTSGEILIDGEDVLKLDPVALRRRIGYVMQQGGLFPHRRVADNVAVVPRLLGWDRSRTQDRVQELLNLVGLDPGRFARRFPHELSGGERQRVGVARALAGDPPVLLMDEPFGAVDPVTRANLQSDFWNLQVNLKKTVIFVTHDLNEATSLATTMAVMRIGGHLEQYGPPAEILAAPATPFVSEFVGKDRSYQQLGVTMIQREDLSFVPILAPTTTSGEAAKLLDASGSRVAIVLDGDERPLGWLRRDDASGRALSDDTSTIGQLLRPVEGSVSLGSSLRGALALMLSSDTGFAPVVDDGRYAGTLTLEDVHDALRRADHEESTIAREKAERDAEPPS